MQTSLRRRHRDRVVRRVRPAARWNHKPPSHSKASRADCCPASLAGSGPRDRFVFITLSPHRGASLTPLPTTRAQRAIFTRPTPAARTSPTSSRASGELRPHPLCRHRDAAQCSPRLCSVLRSYCVQETCNFDVLYAYLTCGNYDCAPSSIEPRNCHSHTHTTIVAHVLLCALPFSSLVRQVQEPPCAALAPRLARPASPSAVLRAQAPAATSARRCSTRS